MGQVALCTAEEGLAHRGGLRMESPNHAGLAPSEPNRERGLGSTQPAGSPCPLLQGRGPVAAWCLSGVSAHLQGGKGLGSSATLVVAALGRWQGLGLPPRGPDRNAQFSVSLTTPPESDHEVTLAPGLLPILGKVFGPLAQL